MKVNRFIVCTLIILLSVFDHICSVSFNNLSPWISDAKNKSFTSNLYSQRTFQKVKHVEDPAIFLGRPKTREERWYLNFFAKYNPDHEQSLSLVNLLLKIVQNYLNSCIPIVLYDQYVEIFDSIMLQSFLQKMEVSYLHGKISQNYSVMNQELLQPNDKRCRSYILFLDDVLRTRDVLGPQTTNRVILIPRSTQWKVQGFLSSKLSSDIINLLVIGQSLTADPDKEFPYVLYTHRLYTDGLGSNIPIVLTSWIKGKLSRPHVNLFPKKFSKGFAGHRFTVTAIHQPPYAMKKLSTDGVGNINIEWDGIEIRLLKLLSQRLNFSFEILEPKSLNELGPTYGVINLLDYKRADIGLAGAYISNERLGRVEMSYQHSKDCAAFITLASKALPRYRAIMGPFQWPVWVSIIAVYMFAMFPLVYTDRLTLRHLIGNWSEMENMFWYVYGTFTNSLTFSGSYSWSNSKKASTRILIGTYWIFSIIITACYTSSIIAFVTLPVFPDTVDTVDGLLEGSYRVGTFAKDGWQHWFANSSHKQTKKLFKNLELVANLEEGLSNVTKAFFWGYAFIGSRSQLEYVVQKNFSFEGAYYKRSALHIGDECVSIFGIAFMYPKNSVYTVRLNEAILEIIASGLMEHIYEELAWDTQRKSSSQLLQATNSKKFSLSDIEERKLNLADTEGMFLLMGVGYLVAGGALVSEIVGGCSRRFCAVARRTSRAVSSATSSLRPNSSRRSSIDTQADDLSVSVSDIPRRSIFNYIRRSFDRRDSDKSHRRNNSIAVGVEHAEVYTQRDNDVGNKKLDVISPYTEILQPPTP